MLQNAYFLAKIGADTAKIELLSAETLPIGRRVILPAAGMRTEGRRRRRGRRRARRRRAGRPARENGGVWQNFVNMFQNYQRSNNHAKYLSAIIRTVISTRTITQNGE